MRHRPILAALALLPLTAAAAQAPTMPTEAPGKPDTRRAVSGTYAVDSAHTQVLFKVNHLGFSDYVGQFIKPTGTLTLDTRRPANSRVEIVFPIKAVSTTDAGLDKHLLAADFFEADKYPEARFVSTRVQARGNRAMITGNLTLRGVTRSVILNTRFVGAGTGPMDRKTNVGFAATTTIKRSDFGIAYGIPLVSDAVELTINAAFVAQ